MTKLTIITAAILGILSLFQAGTLEALYPLFVIIDTIQESGQLWEYSMYSLLT